MKNYPLSAHTLLSIHPLLGGFCLLVIFCFCFIAIHLVKLAKRGWQITENPFTHPVQKTIEPEKKAPATPPQEPIYYIVERKQTRKKSRYTTPKEFRFKE